LEKYLNTVVEVFVTTLSICQSLTYLRHTMYVRWLFCWNVLHTLTSDLSSPVNLVFNQSAIDRRGFRVCFLTRLWPTLRDGPSFHGSIAVTQ